MKKNGISISLLVVVLALLISGTPAINSLASTDSQFDIVINNGKIMDPFTRTSIKANMGIRNGRISAIVPLSKELQGNKTINASGLIVAPGFIDVHAHEGDLKATMKAFLRDGVTTMIGGNCGGSPFPIKQTFQKLEQNGSFINYAAYVGHTTLRNKVGAKDRYKKATKEQIEEMKKLVEQEMKSGALGVSYGTEYVPGANYEELLALAKVAEKHGGATAAHIRYSYNEPKTINVAVKEMIDITRETGTPFLLSHITSMLGNVKDEYLKKGLKKIREAQSEGLPVVADAYPYTVWKSYLGAAFMDVGSGGWFDKFGRPYNRIAVLSDVVIDGEVVMEQGDRFTKELYEKVRPKVLNDEISDPGILGYSIAEESVITAYESSFVMVSSDGEASYSKTLEKYTGHPRTAGTYARFIGHWVRDKNRPDLSLMDALFKTSTMPALHFGLNNKGRITVGADADLTLFDYDTIKDKAWFGDNSLESPEGIEYVIVNGKIAVNNGHLKDGVNAGTAIRRTWDITGYSMIEKLQ